jgi:hypothetical protein
MSDYHDRSMDDPHPPAEDRPVAGWPAHQAEGEHRDENAREEEPLVGEVWSEDAPAENAGEHGETTGTAGETTGTAGETTDTAGEEHDRGRFGEFGTEEPIIVSDSIESEEPAAASDPAEAGETTAEGGENAPEGDAADHAETAAEAAGTVPAEDAGPVAADTGARPTDGDGLTVDRIVDDEAAGRIREHWRDVKGAFVDDPADAVRQASTLANEAVEELTAALARLRENLDGHWSEGQEADTERLRVALRGYGSLIDRVLGH